MNKIIKKNFIALGLFAVAFAFVEASVVVYLREIFGLRNLTQNIVALDVEPVLNLGIIAFLKFSDIYKIISNSFILNMEIIRELSTLIIFGSVAYLNEKSLKRRIWIFLYIFSIWDLSYYLFLRLSIGWPKNLLDIDIFFLLPVPWVGPVILPLIIFSLILILSIFKLSKLQSQ